MRARFRRSRGFRKLFALPAAIVVTLIATAAPSAVAAGGANHVVVALATADGASLSRSGVQVAPAGGDTVDSDNLAKATSFACTGCRSVAVAFQTVIATRNPSVVTPTNAAVAVNAGCTGCVSYAFAYQYVFTTDGPALLSREGHERIAAVRATADELAASTLPLDELTIRLDALADDFKAAVDEELRLAGRPSSGTVSRRLSVDGGS